MNPILELGMELPNVLLTQRITQLPFGLKREILVDYQVFILDRLQSLPKQIRSFSELTCTTQRPGRKFTLSRGQSNTIPSGWTSQTSWVPSMWVIMFSSSSVKMQLNTSTVARTSTLES